MTNDLEDKVRMYMICKDSPMYLEQKYMILFEDWIAYFKKHRKNNPYEKHTYQNWLANELFKEYKIQC